MNTVISLASELGSVCGALLGLAVVEAVVEFTWKKIHEIKPFYISRLWDDTKPNYGGCKDFDYIVLINGYRHDSPRISLLHPKIEIRSGKTEWGAKDNITNYFVITWEFIR